MSPSKKERCPVCELMRVKSAVVRLEPVEHEEGGIGVRWAYRCSKGHEFLGADFKRDPEDRKATFHDGELRISDERYLPE